MIKKICFSLLLLLMVAVPFYDASAQVKSRSADIRGIGRLPNSEGFADLVEKLSLAVVNIRSLQTENVRDFSNNVPPEFEELLRRFGYNLPPGGSGNQGNRSRRRTIAGIGSGFIISSDGLIVTNSHVIKNATEVRVTLANDRTYIAKLVGRDDRTDIALLKIKARNLPFLKFGNSNKLRVGNWVIAIGNPIGLGGSVSAGIVSALGRNINAGRYDDFIQTDAAINRGNSGGPLFNIKGEVVGINSIIYSETGGSIGIGFAIPSNQAFDIIKQIKRYGEARRSWLGVALQEVDENLAKQFGLSRARGALVVGVIEKSPASRSELKIGDIILAINNQNVKKSQTLSRLVASAKSGSPLPLTVWRNKRTVRKNIVLAPLKKTDAQINKSQVAIFKKIRGGGELVDKLGFAIRDITNHDRKLLYLPDDLGGVLISAVANRVKRTRRDQRFANDIMVGTLILSINDRRVRNSRLAVAELKKLTSRKKPFSLFIFIPGSGFLSVNIDPTS
ncbi:MAG: Do family serine endopeptidase [Alphaproteobacteria bacterium]